MTEFSTAFSTAFEATAPGPAPRPGWVDCTDPLVISAIVTGCADPSYVVPDPPDDTVCLSVGVASDILARLSGFTVHPAGTVTEDFVAVPTVHRLSPNFRPITDVISVNRMLNDCTLDSVDIDGWCVFGQSIYFSPTQCNLVSFYRDVCNCLPVSREMLRVEYTVGNTVTDAAERAVLYLARQLWLECHPDEGDCELPDRVTTVNREGLSYTIFDPAEYLQQGRTGVPRVDLWLASINPSRALRPSGVYTPDSPPPVNRKFVMSVVDP